MVTTCKNKLSKEKLMENSMRMCPKNVDQSVLWHHSITIVNYCLEGRVLWELMPAENCNKTFQSWHSVMNEMTKEDRLQVIKLLHFKYNKIYKNWYNKNKKIQ